MQIHEVIKVNGAEFLVTWLDEERAELARISPMEGPHALLAIGERCDIAGHSFEVEEADQGRVVLRTVERSFLH